MHIVTYGHSPADVSRTTAEVWTVLEDDRLITHLSVTSDTLLEPVPEVLPDEAVRLIVDITVRPYRAYAETAGYA